MKLKSFITNIVIVIVLVISFTACDSPSSRRRHPPVFLKTYTITYKGYLSGKFIKRSTLISARTTIEAVQILKEQTFVGFDSISVNSIRPQQ